ncbi:MAG: hypothetical protein GXW85_08080 [Clostridia bacterium]|nr:hypothetical protein [Clostridia bacterium]
MKTLILSNFDLISRYIKEALSDLQPYAINKHSWFKGKFYTKELYLVEKYESNTLGELLDLLIIDGAINTVISVGAAQPLNSNLKQGDILINDYPASSCQKLMDRFLNDGLAESEDLPLRIFAGNILTEAADQQNPLGLTCLDCSCKDLFSILQAKGLSTLAIRLISSRDDSEIINNVVPKLLLLLKQTVEKAS